MTVRNIHVYTCIKYIVDYLKSNIIFEVINIMMSVYDDRNCDNYIKLYLYVILQIIRYDSLKVCNIFSIFQINDAFRNHAE